MRERSVLRGLPVTGVAVAGVILGHWLAYVIALPQPEIRAAVLAASGHSYWLLAVKLAVVLAVSGLAALVARLVKRGDGRRSLDAERLPSLVARLALLQIPGFLAMEATERLASGAALSGLLHHSVLVVGILVQVVVAFVGAVALRSFGRAAERVVRSLRAPLARPSRGSPGRHALALVVPRHPQVLSGAGGLRGPPSF